MSGPTRNTLDLWLQVRDLSKEEIAAGGVLDMDTEVISTIKEFTDNILIGFTCFFQKTDFVYADPIAFVLHAMVQDRDSERTHSIADQNHFELCTLDRMIILRDFD